MRAPTACCPALQLIRQRARSDLEGKTIVVRPDKGGGGGSGGKGKGKGRGAAEDAYGGDGTYANSGLSGKNGWVKPTGADFDDAPPPDPKRKELSR